MSHKAQDRIRRPRAMTVLSTVDCVVYPRQSYLPIAMERARWRLLACRILVLFKTPFHLLTKYRSSESIDEVSTKSLCKAFDGFVIS